MIFKWPTETERLLKFMRIPPKKKLEWLYQMNEFIRKASTVNDKQIRRNLRK